MKVDFNKIFQVLVVIILIYVILILNTIYQGRPSLAQNASSYVTQAPDAPIFPVKITNLEQFSPKFVSAFSVNKENQFVVVDNLNRSIIFYEIIWNGPTPAIQLKANTSF